MLRLVWVVVAEDASEVARIDTSLRGTNGRFGGVVGGLGANGFWDQGDAKFGVGRGVDWKLELEMEMLMLLSRAIGLRSYNHLPTAFTYHCDFLYIEFSTLHTIAQCAHNLCILSVATTALCTTTSAQSQFRPTRRERQVATGIHFNARLIQWQNSTLFTSAEATARKRFSLRANCENPTSPPTPSWTRDPTRMESATSTVKSHRMRSSTWTGDAS